MPRKLRRRSDWGKRQAGNRKPLSSAPARHFAIAFTPGSRILDIGCGSGRDLKALIDAGYDANGIDATREMLGEAKAKYPTLAARLTCDTLPNLASVADSSYDGILCWAVLMHLPDEFLFDTVFNLRRVLKPGGRLLISTPLDGPTVDPSTLRDPHGRLFNGMTPENFHFVLEKVGFRRINRWDEEDSLGRKDRRWATQLFVLESQGSRSLNQIEAILNRDKKDATYKPALFRALPETGRIPVGVEPTDLALRPAPGATCPAPSCPGPGSGAKWQAGCTGAKPAIERSSAAMPPSTRAMFWFSA